MKTIRMLYTNKTDIYPSVIIKQDNKGYMLLENVMSDKYKSVMYIQDSEIVSREADKLIKAKIRHRKMMEKRY